MAAGGVEVTTSSVDFYSRQGGRDGERRQTKRPIEADRRWRDGRRDSPKGPRLASQRGEV